MIKEKIFHLTIRNFSRGKGHNAIQKGAYRTGLKIEDRKRGLTFNYEKKSQRENISYEMVLPVNASGKFNDPCYFYNEIERSETRGNSRLFKEIELALYKELSEEENKELARQFSQEIFDKYNVPININFHKLNSDNPHCHIVIAQRYIEGEKFTIKNRDLDKRDFVRETRQRWEKCSNAYFKQKNLMLFVSHRSYEDRGINKIAGRHINRKHLIAEEKQEDLCFNKLSMKHNRRQDFKREKNNVIRTIRQEIELVSLVRMSRLEVAGKEVNEMNSKTTVLKLYNNEIESLKIKYGQYKSTIFEKKQIEKEKRQKLQQERASFKERREKHQSKMFHKKNDLEEMKIGHEELKNELKFYSVFNPFDWKKRQKIKRKMVHNKIKQKRKKLEIKREKEHFKYYKKQLNEKKKDLKKERRDIFELYKKQVVTKVKTIKLSKEKKKTKDLNKIVENILNLERYKRDNKIGMKKIIRENKKELSQ
ncbi:MobA/MobL family protein [Priestia aryabhattai]|uniref:MobA/MobL family protein n=1 Tax=Priestia aryabhattai TaxID=412384 RepID=UPI003D2C627F